MDVLKEYMEDGDVEASIMRFQDTMTTDERLEFMVILEKMLWFGSSHGMKKFTQMLLERGDDIPTLIRCRMAEQVYDADDPDYVKWIRHWIGQDDMEVACRIEWLSKIQRYPAYPVDAQIDDWMTNIFLHESIVADDFCRHRIVMDAYHSLDDIEVFIALMQMYRARFRDPVMYRIMLVQVLLDRDRQTPFSDKGGAVLFLGDVLGELVDEMGSDVYPLEVQADICDFFLHTEYPRITEEHRAIAQRRMCRLFQENMTSSLSLFSNRQNVHSESIETSAQEILQALHEKYGTSGIVSFQQVQLWRAEMNEWDQYKAVSDDDKVKVELALNRIVFDKRLYGKTGDTLSTILGLVWRHVNASDHRDELRKRLLQELVEGSGQCSTGIAVRLVNTLSGFDDFMIRISYRDAILARVVHHLTKTIQSIHDEEVQSSLLNEMTEPEYAYTERKNFMALFRREIPIIKEELYKEYSSVLTDTDFDLYLKHAISFYQGET